MKLVTYYCVDGYGNQGITFRYLAHTTEEAYELFHKDLKKKDGAYTVVEMFVDELTLREVVSYIEEQWTDKHAAAKENPEADFICDVAKLEYLREDVSIFPEVLKLKNTDKKKAKTLYGIEQKRLGRLAVRDSSEFRLVVLSSEMLGFRKAPHDIVYNQILNEKEQQYYNENSRAFLEEMYARLGNRDPQPSDFYGHSPSVGDIFVIMKGNTIDAYSVAHFGFDHEEDLSCVLTPEQKRAAELGYTIREEFELLNAIRKYASETGVKNLSDTVEMETKGRFEFLLDQYLIAFNLAEVRAIQKECQSLFSLIKDTEEYECDSKLVYGPFDGAFYIRNDIVKSVMPAVNYDNSHISYEEPYLTAGDKLRSIIKTRLRAISSMDTMSHVS